MAPSQDKSKDTPPEAGSLEDTSLGGGSLEGGASDEADISPTAVIQPNSQTSTPKDTPSKDKKPEAKGFFGKIKVFVKRFDIYFLGFIFITIVGLIVAGIILNHNKTPNPTANSNQNLSQSALSQLNNNDTNVGGSSQTLNIASNTIFASNVLVKGSLEVAGGLKISDSVTLPGITVSGPAILSQVSAASMTLSGSETVNGSLNVKSNLTADGTGSFNGNLSAPEISTSTLQVNGPIQVAHHITSTGSIVRDAGVTLGSGGTTTVNGNDTAGTINVNTGGGVSGSNCLAAITYSQSYGSTPHVVVTPVGSAAGSSQFYITNSSGSGFTLCADATPASATFSFNYFVID